jgi:cytochrome c553
MRPEEKMPEAKIMNLTKSTITAVVVTLSAVFAFAGYSHAESCGAPHIEPSNYVARNCAYCHGPSVQGYAIAPRLAGQHNAYLVIQLNRLRSGERNNPFSVNYMSHVAANVLPENECELAAYLSTLPPEAAGDGDEALAAMGEQIFKIGAPSDKVPACQFCHGPDGQGVGMFPRLAGQSYYYLKRRLEQWSEGYTKLAPHMPGIASQLSSEQIDAVASYLSFVR